MLVLSGVTLGRGVGGWNAGAARGGGECGAPGLECWARRVECWD